MRRNFPDAFLPVHAQFFDENMILRDVAIGTCKVPLAEVRACSLLPWHRSRRTRAAPAGHLYGIFAALPAGSQRQARA